MNKFAKLTLNWYFRNARVLPWRNHPDPYAIWVSEIMLQQTQVATVIPYFERWMNRFPDIPALARATEGEVLRMWEGLGYYARARNLHKAARMVMENYAGILPPSMGELKKLPGVGRYTAAAIASMAFGQDEATLDGNIKRVLSRVFKISEPVNTTHGEKILWGIVNDHLPAGRAGDYNQALMDIGALICLPIKPDCLGCPLKRICEAKKKGLQEKLPVVKNKLIVPSVVKSAIVVVKKRNVLLLHRKSTGLLGGMWEFPSVEVDKDLEKELIVFMNSQHMLKVFKKSHLLTIRHAYSHFKLTEHAFLCTLKSESKLQPGFKWIPLKELSNFPMGKVDRQIANKLLTEENG
jgi:A/G-specific adenine glycosylase